MSFNRLKYDNCAYTKEISESVSPLDYYLFKGKYENCEQCPVGNATNNLEFGKKANLESELYGLNREQSKCPSKKYDPSKPFTKPDFSPSRLCESVYYITPTNMKMPTSNGIDDSSLGVNCCNNKK